MNFKFHRRVFETFGFINGLKFTLYNHQKKFEYSENAIDSKSVSIYIKAIQKKIFIRTYTSDFKLLRDFFLQDCYDNEYFNPKRPYDIEFDGKLTRPVKYVLDLGANIGLFTLLGLQKFPEARFVCVEAEKNNYLALKRNVAFETVKCINAGIWYDDKDLEIVTSNCRNISFYVKELKNNSGADSNIMRGRSISSIMEEEGIEQIDIIKMDIEGAEYEIFRNEEYKKWINNIQVLIIETHERYKPGTDKLIHEIMEENGFKSENVNEDVVFWK